MREHTAAEISNLAQQMITFRAKNNLSQKECAKNCGISIQTWYSIENGYQSPSKRTWRKIELYIGTDTKEE